METTQDLLDQVKARYELPSDYALAKKLGMSRERVSRYRNTNGQLGDEAALKVAELLNLDPAYVLACAAFERTKNSAARTAWEHMANLAKTYGAAAALLLLVAVPGLTPTPSQAAPAGDVGTMYIMTNARRWLIRMASRFAWPRRFSPA